MEIKDVTSKKVGCTSQTRPMNKRRDDRRLARDGTSIFLPDCLVLAEPNCKRFEAYSLAMRVDCLEGDEWNDEKEGRMSCSD